MVFCDPKGDGATEVARPQSSEQETYAYNMSDYRDTIFRKIMLIHKKQKSTSLGDESGVMPYYFRRIRCDEGRKPKSFDMELQR